MQERKPSGQDYGRHICPDNCNTRGALLGYPDSPHPHVQEDTDRISEQVRVGSSNTTPQYMYVASQEGHHDVAQTLLGAGAGVNIARSDVRDV